MTIWLPAGRGQLKPDCEGLSEIWNAARLPRQGKNVSGADVDNPVAVASLKFRMTAKVESDQKVVSLTESAAQQVRSMLGGQPENAGKTLRV